MVICLVDMVGSIIFFLTISEPLTRFWTTFFTLPVNFSSVAFPSSLSTWNSLHILRNIFLILLHYCQLLWCRSRVYSSEKSSLFNHFKNCSSNSKSEIEKHTIFRTHSLTEKRSVATFYNREHVFFLAQKIGVYIKIITPHPPD